MLKTLRAQVNLVLCLVRLAVRDVYLYQKQNLTPLSITRVRLPKNLLCLVVRRTNWFSANEGQERKLYYISKYRLPCYTNRGSTEGYSNPRSTMNEQDYMSIT